MLQQIVWTISLALMMLVGFGWSYAILRSGKREEDYAPLQQRAYRLRSRLFWVLVAVFGTPMAYTLIDLPYDAIRPAQGAGAVQEIRATGRMWQWEISEDHVEAGRPVVFQVTSADVNHGFGIYDPDMKIVAQTQAMPGVTNTLRHTFNREGTYRVMCLEYCGLAHHNMIAEFTVGNRS
jgi:cytochrome c oxidase subunit 2